MNKKLLNVISDRNLLQAHTLLATADSRNSKTKKHEGHYITSEGMHYVLSDGSYYSVVS